MKKEPNQCAAEIVESKSQILEIYEKLKKEAFLIENDVMQKDALQILKKPIFGVIKNRIHAENEIYQILIKEGLILSDSQSVDPIFPKNESSSFIVAPGSIWTGHHSYPGGLLYHTYSNLRIGIAYSELYSEIYKVNLRNDYIRFAAILHDSAKTITLPWKEDGSCETDERQIARTPIHHILAIAEAIFRQYPIDFIITLASAHTRPLSFDKIHKPNEELIGFLKAGAIIAGLPYTCAGLNGTGDQLSIIPPIEAFINHLDDGDYILTCASIQFVDQSLNEKLNQKDFWKRNEILSTQGDLLFYQKLTEESMKSLK